MLDTINSRFNAEKMNRRENQFITESVLGVEEVLPGSEEEMEDVVDVDSIPQEVYNKVDKALDGLIDGMDDTEISELIDGDDEDDESSVDDAELDAIVNEACEGTGCVDDEPTLGHCAESRSAMGSLKLDNGGNKLPEGQEDPSDGTVDGSGKKIDDDEDGAQTWTDDDQKPGAGNQTPEVKVVPEGQDAPAALKENSNSLRDMYAISRGFDRTLVEAVGGEYLISLDEGTARAIKQAHDIKTSQTAKDAKAAMKEAQQLAKIGDKTGSLRKYDEAIKHLETLKKQCDDIEDDTVVGIMVDSAIRTIVPTTAAWLTSFIPYIGTATYVIGLIYAYIKGTEKSLNFTAAVQTGKAKVNKAGVGGKEDLTSADRGVTRADAIVRLDRMITVCEKAKEEIKKAKPET